MMKNIEDILTRCIEDIKSGNASLEECLDRYPDMRRELEPLLKLALNIQEPPDVRPSDAFKIKARVNLMEYIHSNQADKKARNLFSLPGLRNAWRAGVLRTATIFLAVLVAVSALGTGMASASQSSIPGDILYPVKLGTEQVQRLFNSDDISRVELELKLAGIRLDEMEAVAQKRPETLSKSVSGYEKNLNLAISKAEESSSSSLQFSLQEKVALAIANHLSTIDEIEDSVPEQAEYTVNTREIAINGHITVLQSLAKVDPLRAAEINMETMQNRLNRAEVESEKGNASAAQRALQDFQRLLRFGEEISVIGREHGYDTIAVDGLNANATEGHMETLGYIYGITPEETKGAVEEAIGTSIEEYREAIKGLQQQGATEKIPEEPQIPAEIPDDIKKRILESESQGPGNGKR